ncbi:hypothetical protein D918_04463 [Trichuris suis]|nr:hypothetical protein D918_04463 [Trichuris suis]
MIIRLLNVHCSGYVINVQVEIGMHIHRIVVIDNEVCNIFFL